MTAFRPCPPHNPLKAPAVCLCAECSHHVLTLRCPAVDDHGRQCGDYRHRGKEHTLLICTTFQIAMERAT